MPSKDFLERKQLIEEKYGVRLPSSMEKAIGVYFAIQDSEYESMNEAYLCAVTELFGKLDGFKEELDRQSSAHGFLPVYQIINI